MQALGVAAVAPVEGTGVAVFRCAIGALIEARPNGSCDQRVLDERCCLRRLRRSMMGPRACRSGTTTPATGEDQVRPRGRQPQRGETAGRQAAKMTHRTALDTTAKASGSRSGSRRSQSTSVRNDVIGTDVCVVTRPLPCAKPMTPPTPVRTAPAAILAGHGHALAAVTERPDARPWPTRRPQTAMSPRAREHP